MGADIHMVLERSTKEFGWVGIQTFASMSIYNYAANEGKGRIDTYCSIVARNRNYELFAKLAGVRGDGPEPKGLPDDASPLTLMKLSEENDDLHSHTWWMLEQALPLFAAPHLGAQLLEPNARNNAMRMFGLYEGEDDAADYRLCIAFDN